MSKSKRIGTTAVETIGALLEVHREITELALFEPSPAPLAQERLTSEAKSHSIIEAGLLIRNGLGLPFWDSVLLSCFNTGINSFPILQKALFHNSPPSRELLIARSDWSAERLDCLIQQVQPGQILVVRSRVRLHSGEYSHIPMLDFHCPSGAANQEICAQVAQLLLPSGGYLLDSGQSYHFYGKSLIRERDFFTFLGRALLLSPIIDRAWVAHQLIEGACGLRISPKPESGKIPRVIVEL